MTIEEIANRCLQERGYIVGSSPLGDPFRVGEVLPEGSDGFFGDLRYPLVVVAQTDVEDAEAQDALFGWGINCRAWPSNFYRLVAE